MTDSGAGESAVSQTVRKTTKALPTIRIAVGKQLEVLRVYGAVHANTGRPVSNTELGAAAKLNVSSASYNNTFFAECGLIVKVGNGYVPSVEVSAFNRAYQFDPKKAGFRLAPVLRKAWFAEVVLLQLMLRDVTEDDLFAELATACSGDKTHIPQFRVLLQLLETAGLILRDGSRIESGPTMSETDTARPEEPAMQADAQMGKGKENHVAESSPADGGINLSITIKIGMAELVRWKPDALKELFEGIGKIMGAKAALEK